MPSREGLIASNGMDAACIAGRSSDLRAFHDGLLGAASRTHLRPVLSDRASN